MDIEAIVTRTGEGHAFVRITEKSGGCGRCNEAGGCNSGVLTQVFKRDGVREFRLDNDIGARTGDRVVVSLADGATLKAAMAVYMLPVICVLLGAGIGTWLGGAAGNDRFATFGAVGGFVLSLALVAIYRRRHAASGVRPVMSRFVAPGGSCGTGSCGS